MDVVWNEQLNQDEDYLEDKRLPDIFELNVSRIFIKIILQILQLVLLNDELKVDVGWIKNEANQINFEVLQTK